MRTTISAILLSIFPALLLVGGCAIAGKSEPRSASDIFFDTAEGLVEFFETDEITADRNRAREVVERRRKWQLENLSDSELRQLGVKN